MSHLDPSIAEKADLLRSRGWRPWYNPDYWVHEKTVVDPSRQDYTNYGLSFEEAYRFETENHEPWSGQLLGHWGPRWR